MTHERWQRVKEIFNTALQYSPDERVVFLSSACGDDDTLRREVESLLASHEREGDFMDSPAYEVGAQMLTDDPELAPGQAIGYYEIVSILGKGGMGEVYLAEDTRLRRKVALKFLPREFTMDDERLRRFEQEARAASALNHPNILTIHEVGKADGRRFMVTEFIDGQTLRHRLETRPLTVGETLSVGEQVASALVAAHAGGIVHRDIKPENIMLRHDGIVKVLDFGLAKLIEFKAGRFEDSTQTVVRTSTGKVMGTVNYMSPEQARGLPVDARTDLWSLGAVLYEMVAGRAPFEGPTPNDVIASVLEREPPSLAGLAPQAPEALEWIVTKALTKKQEDRYQTAREILTDLRRVKQRLDAAAAVPSTASPLRESAGNVMEGQESRSGIPKNQRVAFFALALVALLAVSGFAIYKLLTQNASPSPNATGLLRTTQLTTSSGLDLSPTFSPDGSSMAYSSDRSGGFEIYIKSLAPGGREIQLTTDGEQNLEPAWSPDGKVIAYYSWRRGGIWIVPALGGTARQLTEFGSMPAWSHDSTWIAFQSEGMRDLVSSSPAAQPPSTLWVVSSHGGAARQITQVGHPTGGHGAPSWSPDTKRILFSTGLAVWMVSSQGDDLKRVSPDLGMVFGGVYGPDGKNVYYSGWTREFYFGLWQQPISAIGEVIGVPIPMANTGSATAKFLAISADGKNLAYTGVSTTSHLWSIPAIQSSGGTTGSPSRITSGTNLRNALPVFSPDGRKLAFVVWRTGTDGEIWVMDSDGQNAAQLTTDSANHQFPSWFPGGNEIAYSSSVLGTVNIESVIKATSLKTGKDRVIFDVRQPIGFPRLSPDGKFVAFNSNKSGPINIWVGSVETGQLKQLTFDKEMMGFPCWSPDGKLLAFEIKRGDDNHIVVMPSTGGAVTQLTSEPGLSWQYDWSPDGDKIAFAGQRNGLWNIYWVSHTTKEQKQLTHYSSLNEFVHYPAWSPLGNQIVYEKGETTGNLWLTELK
jgi:eukaryotic-like serine/threonine-protein kinase